ncbi:MAG TPA: hypothetical protein PK325_03800 [Cyclobacteriaceae bacterium]|nr:hypothetical protein [Cyclobacteriaceae bacterium]HMV07937.1 hypothetical protein [Cyclobacteriaceae bacterium]HMX48296.1 hypothetical protein [Cyclobacteriaceae bacterium]HMY95101.1 hypothetical protein [Cyclobacteriaceae bacterium]HND41879.1 hypothetical protein [Cyclobacteriaceae bacterium]
MSKPHSIRIAVSAVLLFLVLGCTSSKIESNKDPQFNQKVSKIFITLRVSEGSWGFFRPFIYDYLQPELKAHKVETIVHNFGPLSLESDKDVVAKIVDYQPDVVMSIVQTERRSTSGTYGNSETGATMDIKMFLPKKENPVWRASFKVDANFDVASYAAAKRATVKLIEKMKADGIID